MIFVILEFAIIIYIGYLVTWVIIKKARLLERLGLSYLLGIGLYTLLVYFYSMIGLKINLLSLMISAFLSIALLTIILRKIKYTINLNIAFKNNMYIFGKMPRIDRLILYTIIFFCFLSFVIALYQPITVWDALALYDFRAKIIASQGYFGQIVGNFNYFAHYPLLTSLAHTFVYIIGDHNPQFIYPLFLISFVFVFYALVRHYSSQRASLLACLFLVTSPIYFEHSTIAYTNLPYAVYFSLGIIYLYKYLIDRNNSLIVPVALLIGLSTWVRSDYPFWAVPLVFVVVYSIISKKYSGVLLYTAIFLSIQQPWRIFQASLFGKSYTTLGQINYGVEGIARGINIEKLLDIIHFIYRNIIVSWGTLFLLFMVILTIEIRSIFRSKKWIFILLLLGNLSLIILGTLAFSDSFSEWKEIPDSANRMSMFFIPLFIYFIATSNVVNDVILKK